MAKNAGRHRHQPLMAALALGDEHPPLAQTQILEAQPEHLAAAQTAQHHRLHHGPVPLGAQRRHQRGQLVGIQDARQSAHRPHQRLAPQLPSVRDASAAPAGTGLVVHPDIAAGDQIAIERRHRGQPTADRRRRQPRACHRRSAPPSPRPAGPALRGHEPHHVRRRDLDRLLGDDREERLQIMRVGPHRVRPGPASGELQELIDQPMTNDVHRSPPPSRAIRRTCGDQTMRILLVRAPPERSSPGGSAQVVDHPYKCRWRAPRQTNRAPSRADPRRGSMMAGGRRRTAERAAFSGARRRFADAAQAFRRSASPHTRRVSLGLVRRRFWVVVARWNGAELGRLIEEVLVDAYNDSERLTAFETAFDEARFPISGRLLGRPVVVSSVTSMATIAADSRAFWCPPMVSRKN